MKRCPSGGDLLLYGLLAATIVVPPLAIIIGSRDGQVFTLYREPKLSALQILGWTLVVLVLWRRRRSFSATAVTATLRQPFFAALTAFIAWAAVTGCWARVPENLFYELNQYFFILVFAVVLAVWARAEVRVESVVLYSLAFSLAPLTLVGCAQLVVDVPFLRSIDPGYGVENASFMGYKNPMALALVGHFFVLLYVTWQGLRTGRKRLVGLALAGYALAELLYMVLLQSRSTYVALAVSFAVLGGVLLAGMGRPRRLVAAAAAVVVVGGLCWLLVLAQPAVRARFASLAEYLADPRTFLASDRGTYLRNTLNMVRHRPFGVGLGDWQTHYPVYRQHNRYLAFDDEFQARRAHSDHVQFIGELGYPGVALWLTLLLAALLKPMLDFLTTRRVRSLFLAIQIFALVVATATDYVVEHPFHKFQFFLVCALAAIAGRSAGDRGGWRTRGRRYVATGLATVVTMVGAANVAYYSLLLAKNYRGAMLTVTYLKATADLRAGRAAAGAGELREAERWGRRWAALGGHGKTHYRHYLMRAHVAHLEGRIPCAVELLRESLRLHPYHPNAFRLLAEILATAAPAKAAEYRKIYDYVMNRATEGFPIRYPAFLDRRRAPSHRQAGAPPAVARRWRAVLAGRALGTGRAAPVPRGEAARYLHFCSDGRFYLESEGPAGLAVDFGWWRITTAGGEVLAQLRFTGGEGAGMTLRSDGDRLLVDGREATVWERNEVCR